MNDLLLLAIPALVLLLGIGAAAFGTDSREGFGDDFAERDRFIRPVLR